MWLTQLLKDLHSLSTTTPLLWCDNMGAIALANNPIFHARTKHVEVDYHFIREKIQLKALTVDHVPASHQLADIFTKPLNSPHFMNLKSQFPLFFPDARCFPGGNHLEGGCEDSDLNHIAKADEVNGSDEIAAMACTQQSEDSRSSNCGQPVQLNQTADMAQLVCATSSPLIVPTVFSKLSLAGGGLKQLISPAAGNHAQSSKELKEGVAHSAKEVLVTSAKVHDVCAGGCGNKG